MTAGVLLILFGLVGFLPVVGFWMLPLGIIVLSFDVAPIRRFAPAFRNARTSKARKGVSKQTECLWRQKPLLTDRCVDR